MTNLRQSWLSVISFDSVNIKSVTKPYVCLCVNSLTFLNKIANSFKPYCLADTKQKKTLLRSVELNLNEKRKKKATKTNRERKTANRRKHSVKAKSAKIVMKKNQFEQTVKQKKSDLKIIQPKEGPISYQS